MNIIRRLIHKALIKGLSIFITELMELREEAGSLRDQRGSRLNQWKVFSNLFPPPLFSNFCLFSFCGGAAAAHLSHFVYGLSLSSLAPLARWLLSRTLLATRQKVIWLIDWWSRAPVGQVYFPCRWGFSAVRSRPRTATVIFRKWHGYRHSNNNKNKKSLIKAWADRVSALGVFFCKAFFLITLCSSALFLSRQLL